MAAATPRMNAALCPPDNSQSANVPEYPAAMTCAPNELGADDETVGLASKSQPTYAYRSLVPEVHAENANLFVLTPTIESGLNNVVNTPQFWVWTVTEVMNGPGVAAAAPCDNTAPVDCVRSSNGANCPVANAMVDTVPESPDVKMKPPDTESYVTVIGVAAVVRA